MSNPLKKSMAPGTVWTRVNHQFPDRVGGEIVVEKGTPVKVRVARVLKDGLELEILGRPGTLSYLSWPDPHFLRVTTEPGKITIENRNGALLTYTRDMSEARRIVDENIDSYEGGALRPAFASKTVYDYYPTPSSFQRQWPAKPQWHPGHRSSRMSLNRNRRRRSFGYTDAPSSLRDRGWPYANRGYDRRYQAWLKAVERFGQVRGPGEGI